MFEEPFEINSEIMAKTEKAVLVVVDGDQYWIPMSQILDDTEELTKGEDATFFISGWLAKKLGFV